MKWSADLLDLNGQETARALDRRLKHYLRPQLLCIDEIGYLAYDAHAADLLLSDRDAPLRAEVDRAHDQLVMRRTA